MIGALLRGMGSSSPENRRQNDLNSYPQWISCRLAENSQLFSGMPVLAGPGIHRPGFTEPAFSQSEGKVQTCKLIRRNEFFAASGAKPVASTANEKDGTIDVVWYTGAQVARRDPDTGDPYMLTLDMDGARLDRLNAGAPVFDTHFSGDDYKSVISGKAGTKAQVGVVNKAWADGTNGMATLKFDLGDEDGAELFRKVSSGIVQNLSFGALDLQPRENDRYRLRPKARRKASRLTATQTRSACSRRPIGNRSRFPLSRYPPISTQRFCPPR